jgi:hypothetical protein
MHWASYAVTVQTAFVAWMFAAEVQSMSLAFAFKCEMLASQPEVLGQETLSSRRRISMLCVRAHKGGSGNKLDAQSQRMRLLVELPLASVIN